MAEKLLEINGVSKIFRIGGMIRGKKLVAVDDVTLSIDSDKPVILSIVGESGCGKSTLCKMILRLHRPDMGDIVLDGKSYLDKKDIIRSNSSWMFSPSSRTLTILSPLVSRWILTCSTQLCVWASLRIVTRLLSW